MNITDMFRKKIFIMSELNYMKSKYSFKILLVILS